MSSINKAMILGHLGGDPEVRYAQSGKAVANFTVATSERWTDQSGNRQERTEWHRITAWGKTAELCKQYIRKGSQVFIEGRIQTRKWQDKDGADRYTTEIVADQVTFLDKAPDRQQQQSGGSGEQRQGGQSGGWGNRQQTPPPSDSGGFSDDDLPF